MKSRKITKLFAVVLAASMAVTSAPQTALTVFAATEDDAGNVQEPPAEKYQPKWNDVVIVQDTVVEYNGSKQQVDNVVVLRDKGEVKIIYKDVDGQVVSGEGPVDVGIYKVYVSYEGDDHCLPLPETDTGKTLTIQKADDDAGSGQETPAEKHQTSLGDITVEDTVVEYRGYEQHVRIVEFYRDLDWNKIKFIYKDADGQTISGEGPINVGTYKVYVSYEGDDYCTPLPETDTGKTLTIQKEEVYNRISSYIINKHNTSEECCDVSVLVEGWKENFEDTVVSADVTVDNADSAYIDGLGYADGNIKFKLTPQAADLTETKRITVHADFGESFHNYKAVVDILVVIIGKSRVVCYFNPPEEAYSYDGNVKELTYRIIDGPGGFEDIYEKRADEIGKYFTVDFTKDGKTVTEIRNAGNYTVHMIYEDDVYYGEYEQYIRVNSKEIDNLDGLMSFTATQQPFTMTGEDCAEEIKKGIHVTDPEAMPEDSYKILFRDKESYRYLNERNLRPGTYEVLVISSWENGYPNYVLNGVIKIGEVTVQKHKTNIDDFTLGGTEQTYFGGPCGSYVEDVIDILDVDKIKLTYKDENGQDIDGEYPVNAGTYKIYASYEGDDCSEPLPETDTGRTLTIHKAEDSLIVSPWILQKDDTEMQKFDVSYNVDSWKEDFEDTRVSADITVDDADSAYVEELGYKDGIIKFKLTPEAADLTENKKILLHVDFGESFHNYKVAFDIPVVITSKSPVECAIDWDTANDFKYDGKAKELLYNIWSDYYEDFKEIDRKKADEISNFTVNIIKDGKTVTEIKDAGQYMVYAVYEDDTYYGELESDVWVYRGTMNLTVIADSSGTPTIKLGDLLISNSDPKVEIEYYQGNTLLDKKPTAAGTYTVEVTYTDEDNLTEPAFGEASFTIAGSGSGSGSGSDSGSGSGSGSGSTTPSTPGTPSVPGNPSVPQKPGSATETKPDGSTVETVTEQKTNAAGKTVAVTTITTKDAAGKVTGITERKVIAEAAEHTSATVTIQTDGNGRKEVTADIVRTGTKANGGTKGTISSAVVSQITEAAGTKDVLITQNVVNEDGKAAYIVKVNASDLVPGSKLKIFKYNEETGEYTLVNSKDYKVSSQGGLALNIKGSSTYRFLNQEDSEQVVEEILDTVQVSKISKTVSKGKTTKISLSKKLNMANVSKVTYSSTRNSVAKVDKKGKITAKKAGTATIKAKVTLKNGSVKTVKMTIKVKQ